MTASQVHDHSTQLDDPDADCAHDVDGPDTALAVIGAIRGFIAAGRAPEIPDRFLTPDARIVVPGARHVPFVGTFSTRPEHIEFFSHLSATRTEWLKVDRVVADGADVVVLGSYSYVVTATDARYGSTFALHLRFAGLRISLWEMYEDTWAVANAY